MVEIFWDGDGWYYAALNSSVRIAGPFDTLHKAFKSADNRRFEVMSVSITRGQRSYRK